MEAETWNQTETSPKTSGTGIIMSPTENVSKEQDKNFENNHNADTEQSSTNDTVINDELETKKGKKSSKGKQKRIASLIEFEHPENGKEGSSYDYDDGTIEIVYQATEEGQKVDRNNGAKYLCIYRRRDTNEIKKQLPFDIQRDRNLYTASFNQNK